MADPNYLYVEMACPPSIADGLIAGMEKVRDQMLSHHIVGEWRDRSPILTADNYQFAEMCIVNPLNAAFILHDFRVLEKEGQDKRVFLQIIPMNGAFFQDWKADEWVFIPRVIGNKKSGVIHFITVDIKKKVDDPEMMKQALLKDLGLDRLGKKEEKTDAPQSL